MYDLEEGNWEDELDDIDEFIFSLILTKKQEKAAKKVFDAIRKANEMGVSFFENNGKLSAINSNKVKCVSKIKNANSISLDEYQIDYSEELPKEAFSSLEELDKETKIYFELIDDNLH